VLLQVCKFSIYSTSLLLTPELRVTYKSKLGAFTKGENGRDPKETEGEMKFMVRQETSSNTVALVL
jgi:hypothetical protein